MAKKPNRPARDSTAREVDRLLRQLPGADPHLRGEDPPEPPRPQAAPASPRGPRPPVRLPAPTGAQRAGVWGRVVLGTVAGAALTQWPYAQECGFALWGYLAAVAMLPIVGGWGAMGAWRHRLAVAHVASLLVIGWGGVLAADQVLPRTGYARTQAWWSCAARDAVMTPQPSSFPASPPTLPPVHAVPPEDP